jgi:hypothetical protein
LTLTLAASVKKSSRKNRSTRKRRKRTREHGKLTRRRIKGRKGDKDKQDENK